MDTNKEFEWLVSHGFKASHEEVDENIIHFYYICMKVYGASYATVDRIAYLYTLFGYDIGVERAMLIDKWYYEQGLDVLDLDVEQKGTVQNVAELELGLHFNFDHWPEKDVNRIRYDFFERQGEKS